MLYAAHPLRFGELTETVCFGVVEPPYTQRCKRNNHPGNSHVGSTRVHLQAGRMADRNRYVRSKNQELFGSFALLHRVQNSVDYGDNSEDRKQEKNRCSANYVHAFVHVPD